MRLDHAARKHVSHGALMLAFVMVSVLFALPVHAAGRLPIIRLFTYTGDALPSAVDGWMKEYALYESKGARIGDGMLHIMDRHTYNGAAIHYLKKWQEMPGSVNVAEFDIKVVRVDPFPAGYAAIYIGTSDGNNNMLYTLFSDRILSSYANVAADGSRTYAYGKTFFFDTMVQFNTYKTEIRDGIAKLSINGNPVLEQQAGVGIYDVHGVQFGAGSSAGTGEAYFEEVRAYRESLSVDVRLLLSPRTLNLKSNGRRITAKLEVPAGFDVNEIDLSTVRLQKGIYADLQNTEMIDSQNIMMKFDRADLQISAGEADKVDVVITGTFKDGTPFIGRDSIKVIR